MFSYKYNVSATIDTENDRDWEEDIKEIERRNKNANKQFLHDIGQLSPELFEYFKNSEKLREQKDRGKIYTPIFKSEIIAKQWNLKQKMHKELEFHTSTWGSHNPSWNASVNKWWEKQQNISSNSNLSDKKQKRIWNEKIKNQSNQNAGCSHWDRKYDNNLFHSPFK